MVNRHRKEQANTRSMGERAHNERTWLGKRAFCGLRGVFPAWVDIPGTELTKHYGMSRDEPKVSAKTRR